MDSVIFKDNNGLVIDLRSFYRFSAWLNCRVQTFTVCLFVTSPALVTPSVRSQDVSVNVSRRPSFTPNSVTSLVGRIPIPNISRSRLYQRINNSVTFCPACTFIHRINQSTRTYLFSGRPLCFVRDPNVAKDQPSVQIIKEEGSPLLRAIRVFVSNSCTIFPRLFFPIQYQRIIFRRPLMAMRHGRLTNFFFGVRLQGRIFSAYVSQSHEVFVCVLFPVLIRVCPTVPMSELIHWFMDVQCPSFL